MDRAAIFIDAGYLFAAGGTLCCEVKLRSALTCDYKGLTAAIAAFASKHSGLAVLRTYWYDGARNAVPTLDHLQVAELPHVKLRLGRLSGGEQKGVDSLIVRDFMTLARERAMVTAYLLAGDEDLREGVSAAQDMGVRVVVLGIPAPEGNQAQTLIREADENVMLERDFWLPYFSKTKVLPGPPALSEDPAGKAGGDFAANWAKRATPSELRELLVHVPKIPKELDVQLIKEAEKPLGSLLERQDLKIRVRAGFWKVIKTTAATSFPS